MLLGIYLRDIISWKKFKDCVCIDTNHCLTYANKQCVSEIVLTVHLPYESRRKWGDVKKKASLLHNGTSCSYIQMLNTFLYVNCGYRVKQNCQHVEKRLEKACSGIKRKFVGKSGAAYQKLSQQDLHLALMFNELMTVGEVESTLATEKERCESIEKTNQELNKSLSEAAVVEEQN